MDGRIELNDFYNDGFGWICKKCERELQAAKTPDAPDDQLSRLMREGEAESKQPKFSSLALAKWADISQRMLICPRCGITEAIDKF